MNLTTTANLPELIWVVINGVGLLVTFSLLIRVVGDRRVLRRAMERRIIVPDRTRQILGSQAVRSELIRTVVLLLFFSLGVVFALRAPSRPGAELSPVALVFAGVFILASLLLTLGAILDHRDRRRLWQTSRRAEP